LQRVQLQQVNHRKVQEFLDWLKANHTSHKTGVNEISSRTISNYVRKIHSFLDWCLEDEEYSQFVKLQTIKGIKMPHVEQFVTACIPRWRFDEFATSIL